ncbi:MAG: amidohydrolase family protein, partial [Gemmatimonadaceae bacterium]
NLERGAFGVSAGLDYKPAYFAKVDEVIRALDGVKPWRTFFPNHDRLTPESGFSSRKGMDETVAIGVGAGIVPVFTHMKVQGHEQGSADDVLAMMRKVTAEGTWVAADVYPYLAGQTALAALIIPGWAQDGGISKMRERFADSTMRARIIAESDAAIKARFNGPESIVLNETGRKLSDIMVQQGAKSPGEAVVKVLETEFPSAILSFGLEDDLIKILKYPSAAIACDCGAWIEKRAHPRGFGTFPRILGHYVRETHALTWEEAVRKMSALPASITGLVDRGFIATGMAADIAVFDTATVIDRATYAQPDLKSEGVRVVLVNGVVALRDGSVTGQRGGAALRRSAHMPSRELRADSKRAISAQAAGDQRLRVAAAQATGARSASGSVTFTSGTTTFVASSLGVLQVAKNWASLTGWGRVGGKGADSRAFTLILEKADPMAKGDATLAVLTIDGEAPVTIPLAGKLALNGTGSADR